MAKKKTTKKAAKKTTKKGGKKASKKTGAKKASGGRGNKDGDTLYLGIRNIRADVWEKTKKYAAENGTNAGTVISDALEQFLK